MLLKHKIKIPNKDGVGIATHVLTNDAEAIISLLLVTTGKIHKHNVERT